jgi:hypothetical protein
MAARGTGKPVSGDSAELDHGNRGAQHATRSKRIQNAIPTAKV